MRFGFGFTGFGFTAPAGLVNNSSPPPAELFPDPTLADVADSTDGWQYSNGFPTFGPKGGTGPGLQAVVTTDEDVAGLVGADDAALAALIVDGNHYTVTITFANVIVSKDVFVQIGTGAAVAFLAANGAVGHDVVAGDPGGGQAWLMYNITGTTGAVYDITHISVTTA